MRWIEDTLRDFGHNSGLGELTLDDKGLLSMRIKDSGILYVECHKSDDLEEEALIYLATEKKIDFIDNEEILSLLWQLHTDKNPPVMMTLGVYGEDIFVMIARVSERDFSLPVMENILSLLLKRLSGFNYC